MIPEPAHDDIMITDDNRSLGHAGYGDPDGTPMFYFHGHPGSRLEGAILDSTAREMAIRVIGVDRPGIGRSGFRAKRTIGQWADDIRTLADCLGFERFAVFGISGGGPYAAACAHRLPDRVSVCLLVSSASPNGLAATDGDDGGDTVAANRLQARLSHYAPFLLDIAFASMARSTRRAVDRDGPAATARAALQALPEVDQAVMDDPVRAAVYGGSLAEAFRQGGRGAAWDARLLSRPWGFDPAQLIGPDVHVWHGGLDRNVPVTAGRALALAIPGATARIEPQEGHISIAVNNMVDILTPVLDSSRSGLRRRC